MLIDPGELPEDEDLAAAGSGSGGSGISAAAVPTATGSGAPGMPTIIRRSQWGADESQVTCVPEHSAVRPTRRTMVQLAPEARSNGP